MAQTKKALVVFDPHAPEKSSSDFLIPVFGEADEVKLLSTRSQQTHRYGMVVLTNRHLTANDLFAKIVDARIAVPEVGEALALLSRFVSRMDGMRIGNIVEVMQSDHGFELAVVAKSPAGFGKSTM